MTKFNTYELPHIRTKKLNENQGGGATSGVSSFNGRVGDVVPAQSDYAVEDVDGLVDVLANKADTTHVHGWEEIDYLPTIIQDISNRVDANKFSIENKTDVWHTHQQSDIAGLVEHLQDIVQVVVGKANALHNHAIADVTGLQAALDDKPGLLHTHSMDGVTGLRTYLEAMQLDLESQMESYDDDTRGAINGLDFKKANNVLVDIPEIDSGIVLTGDTIREAIIKLNAAVASVLSQ